MTVLKTALHILHAVLWLASVACAQVTVPESTPAFQPIVAKLSLPVEEGTQAFANWSADPGVKFIPAAEPFTIHVWATPGEHWVKVSATVVRVRTKQVFVPDQQDPTNISKAKLETITEFVSSEVREFPPQKFRVTVLPTDTPHVPPKEPDVPQTPTPKPPTDDDLNGTFGLGPKVRDKINELVPAEFRSLAKGLADAYRKAAEEVIDGKLTPLNAAKRLKELNGGVLTNDASRAAWKPLLDWLGKEMTTLALSGRLTSAKDVVAALSEISLGFNLATVKD